MFFMLIINSSSNNSKNSDEKVFKQKKSFSLLFLELCELNFDPCGTKEIFLKLH